MNERKCNLYWFGVGKLNHVMIIFQLVHKTSRPIFSTQKFIWVESFNQQVIWGTML